MDSCGKRLGIALTTVLVALGLNAVAVVSGVAEHTYGHLLGTEASAHLERADARQSDRALIAKAKTSERCVHAVATTPAQRLAASLAHSTARVYKLHTVWRPTLALDGWCLPVVGKNLGRPGE